MSREFGERIKHARRSVGMEQKDLAKEVQVSVGTVSRWERGLSSPSKAELNAISHYTKTSFFWLKEGVGPMTQEEVSSTIQSIQEPDGSTSNWPETPEGEAKLGQTLEASVAHELALGEIAERIRKMSPSELLEFMKRYRAMK